MWKSIFRPKFVNPLVRPKFINPLVSQFSSAGNVSLKQDIKMPTQNLRDEIKVSHAVYQGPGLPIKFESGLSMPKIKAPTDIIIKVLKTTVCGTDLQILTGEIESCKPGTRIGHEGIGEVIEVGSAVKTKKVGQRVLVSCTTACGVCENCKKKFYGHCLNGGGWRIGNDTHGMQGTYTRIPHADHSTFVVPPEVWDTSIEDDLILVSDIIPSGLELGLMDSNLKPGKTICIVGLGPTGLATLMSTSMYAPKKIFTVDIDKNRLRRSFELGSIDGLEDTEIIPVNNSNDDAVEQILKHTKGKGVDLAIEAVGYPVGWYVCQDVVSAGGHVALLGVHVEPATINLERMWYKNFSLSAGLVHGYTIPMLMERVLAGKLPASKLITHRMKLSEMEKAYDMFAHAPKHDAVKILLQNDLV